MCFYKSYIENILILAHTSANKQQAIAAQKWRYLYSNLEVAQSHSLSTDSFNFNSKMSHLLHVVVTII